MYLLVCHLHVYSRITVRWSTDGCEAVETADNYTVCQCDHLTNFAVLLDTTGNLADEDHIALNIITFVGCAISIICLLLAWLTFQFVK